MKRIFALSTVCLGILLISSCSKIPVASFTMDSTVFKMNKPIAFTCQSDGSKDFSWDFGDGKKSTDENPTHTYTSSGDFTVSLVVSNGAGSDSTSQIITVIPDVTGYWLLSMRYSGYSSQSQTLTLTQHDDNTITGRVSSTDYPAGNDIGPNSKIIGDSVMFTFAGSTTKLNGKVAPNGKTMSGKVLGASVNGTWSASSL